MSENYKPINISFSKIDTYLTCPRKYKLQYKDYIIPSHIPSPFFFGGAIDSASEIILRSKMKGEEFKEFSIEEMEKLYTKNMTEYIFQLEEIYLPTSHLVKYSKSDIALDLLDKDDLADIYDYMDEVGIEYIPIDELIEDVYKSIKKAKNDRSVIPNNVLQVVNYAIWLGLYKKGLMMLSALKEWVDENIKEVHSIQRKIQIKNELGDVLNGAIDFEATMVTGERRTLDLKTASNAVAQYPDNCIETAKQLHIYSQESNPLVGYVVIDKEIRKKEPRVRIRYVKGEVSEEMLDKTFETIDTVMDGIRNGCFDKNKDGCYSYGGCVYRKLCWENSMVGLEERKFEEKKNET